MIWLLSAFSSLAAAHCVLSEAPIRGGTRLEVRADGAAEPCRLVTLRGDHPLQVTPHIVTPGGGLIRLGADHRFALEGGVTAVLVPELLPGDTLRLDVKTEGTKLDFRVGGPLPAPPRGPKQEVRTFTLQEPHPGWAFADPKRATTLVDVSWEAPGKEPLPLPPDATVLEVGALEGGGLLAIAGALLPVEGTAVARYRYAVPGASPQGIVPLGPGDVLEMSGHGVIWVATSSGDVAVRNEGEHLRAEAGPGGGELRYRVASVAGEVVIPDATVFLAGVANRFRSVSLPEPAIPFSLQRIDPPEQTEKLIDVVTNMTTVVLPGAEPLRPRRLNHTWRAGWGTAVEKGLILQAMLVQARLPAEWHLSGAAVDLPTLTGFDHVLVKLGERWNDPACQVCADGEISPELYGKPSLSPWGSGVLPQATGDVARAVVIVGEEVQQTLTLTGVEALRLRVALDGVEGERRERVLRERLGIGSGEITGVEGIEALGAEIRVMVRTAP